MTVLVTLDCQTKPDRTEECIEYLRSIFVGTRQFPGQVALATVRDVNDPAHLVLLEQWARIEDQKAYVKWRGETGALAEIMEFMATPPTITVFDYSPGL